MIVVAAQGLLLAIDLDLGLPLLRLLVPAHSDVLGGSVRWLLVLLLLLGLGGGGDGLLPLDLLASSSCLLAITLHDGSAAIQRRVKSSLLFGSVEILVKWRGAAITWIVS